MGLRPTSKWSWQRAGAWNASHQHRILFCRHDALACWILFLNTWTSHRVRTCASRGAWRVMLEAGTANCRAEVTWDNPILRSFHEFPGNVQKKMLWPVWILEVLPVARPFGNSVLTKQDGSTCRHHESWADAAPESLKLLRICLNLSGFQPSTWEPNEPINVSI